MPQIVQRCIAALLGATLLVVAACTARTNSAMTLTRFAPDEYPSLLSQWNLLTHNNGELQRATDTQIYSINTPLFSDYTLKLRTISLPANTQANYSDFDVLDFPLGTVISKTFYYDTRDVPLSEAASARPALFTDNKTLSRGTDTTRLLETRLLVHSTTGWQALPYVWNDDQSDAVLSLTGALKTIGDNFYVVPSKDECASCHALGRDKVLQPIGPKARHLHSAATDNPLDALVTRGWLKPSATMQNLKNNAVWQTGASPAEYSDDELNHRARSYLDANCGHCHNLSLIHI